MTAARITVVGLGPAGPDWVDGRTHERLTGAAPAFARTRRHPAAAGYEWAGSFDELYDSAESIDDVYPAIVERLLDLARKRGDVTYAVPGSPLVAERTVGLLRTAASAAAIEIEVWPALSFLDVAWLRLGIDPIAAGVELIDGHELAVQLAGRPGPFLVAQADRIDVVDALRAAWDRPPARVVLLRGLGTADEEVLETELAALRATDLDHLTSIYLDGVAETAAVELVRFAELVATLRLQCPWDREQTHSSLRRHLLEETYEVLEAIDALPAGAGMLKSPDHGDGVPVEIDSELAAGYALLEEELGDLLFQVAFHSRLAAEAGQFELADVARTVHDKLVTRHPHVFGTVEAETASSVVANWEQIKKAEKGRASLMDGIPHALPALLFATKVQRKAASVGFDFPEVSDAVGKVHEEIDEFLVDPTEDELGDILFAVVNVGRLAGIDAEAALRLATDKFGRRFRKVEELAVGLDMGQLSLAELDALWDRAKELVG